MNGYDCGMGAYTVEHNLPNTALGMTLVCASQGIISINIIISTLITIYLLESYWMICISPRHMHAPQYMSIGQDCQLK